MSGEWKRSSAETPQPPRHSSTLLVLVLVLDWRRSIAALQFKIRADDQTVKRRLGELRQRAFEYEYDYEYE